MLRGLDLSYAQGRVPQSDWAQLATNGLKFCYAKVAEGMIPRPDVQCADHVKAARSVGMAAGGYFFVHFGPSVDPEKQAELHHQLAIEEGLNLPGDLPPAMDLEWPDPKDWSKHGCTADQLRRDSLAYLNTTKELWGVSPIIYFDLDYWMHLSGQGEPRFLNYPLWIAYYTSAATTAWPEVNAKPLIPRPWTSYAFWQFSGGSMKLPSGVPCDFDVFSGDDLGLVTQKPQPDPVLTPSDPVAGT